MTKDQIIKENVRKQKLVDAGKALFYKYGYRKVTIEEICREAGVSKMTFYRFFENKTDLVKFIMTGLAHEGTRIYHEIMDSDLPFEQKIMEGIRMKREMASQYSDEFLNDVYRDQEGDLMPMLKKLSTEGMALIMDHYRKAQEQGQIRKDLNLMIIPYITNKLNEMVKDPVLLTMYNSDLHEIMKELTNLFFYGIIGNKESKTL